jgi:carboxyl-terminal processing protease
MLPSIVQQFRKSVESFQNTDGLIIDLRGNPGGIGGMAMGIGNLLTQQRDQKLGTMQMRSQTLKFVLNPQAVTYAKPVVVLVDECSASTSEILAQGLRDIGRARVIGTPTAGAALPSVVVELPNGDGFQYAIASYTSSGGMSLEGKGVQPDELVRLDRKSLLAGHDPQVDAAVNWIRSQQNKK